MCVHIYMYMSVSNVLKTYLQGQEIQVLLVLQKLVCMYIHLCVYMYMSVSNVLKTYIQGQENQVFLVLQQPVTISMVKFWNYSRTPQRGVAEIRIAVDGHVAYQGYLRRAPAEGDATSADFSQVCVIFDSQVCVIFDVSVLESSEPLLRGTPRPLISLRYV
jgi:hypothetical protein